MVVKYIQSERDESSKVLDFNHPHQLREIMDHCLNVDDQPRDLEQILSDCKETLKYCVKTGKEFFAHAYLNIMAEQDKKVEDKLLNLLVEICKMVVRYIQSERDESSKVLDFNHPHQLREIMDHCLNVDDQPRDLEQILSDCKEALKYCVKTAHPRFLNQLSTGLDVVGMTAEWITAAANTNMFTYEIAPVFTLMEEVVLQRMLGMIGWVDGDAIFSPGGAISNLYAVLCARHVTDPNLRETGMTGSDHFVVFTSEHSHFSIKKAAILLGIGARNVCSIKTDSRGKMIASELERSITQCVSDNKVPLMVNATCGTTVLGAYDPIQEIADICEAHGIWLHVDVSFFMNEFLNISNLSHNKVPLMVNATCGKTVLGAYDPIQEIADICEAHGVWLHVDGAWGGSVLFSEKHKYLLNGLERADSMTWNPHKMMVVPLQCSAIFLKKKGILESANQLHADYLYQKDKLYDTAYDTGDKAIQCGRHNDVFKLWLMWRSKGDTGFSAQIDHNFEMARYMLQKLKSREDFQLVLEEIEGPNVCFWYVPDYIRAIKEPRDKNFQLHKLTAHLKALMMEKGSMLLQYQPLGDRPNFFRIAFSNPAITTADIDTVIQELVKLGKSSE